MYIYQKTFGKNMKLYRFKLNKVKINKKSLNKKEKLLDIINLIETKCNAK